MGGGGRVCLDLEGPVARLTLDNPAKRNAMSGQMLADLGDAVEDLEAWKGAGLVLKGAGGWFCAGADLDMVAAHLSSPEDGLATACDFRIMDEGSRVQFVQVRMGLSTGWGGGLRLVGLVGRRKALRILGGAEVLDAEAARAVGLADEVCAAGTGEAAVTTFLAPYLQGSPDALRAMKAAIVAGDSLGAKALAAEATAFGEVWGGPAHLEAMASRRSRE